MVTASPLDRQPFAQVISWTEPSYAQQTLGFQPLACLNGGAIDVRQFQAGRALFNTPTLLGGQAAKAGLSCASCHVNGRDSPHFLLPQVSGAAGTADVSNSFFSAARGNARFDPVIIPDLAAPGKISRDPESKALEGFIRNLIVEEFSGEEPSPAMLAALAGYIRLLEPCAVARQGDAQPTVQRTLLLQFGLIDDALDGALYVSGAGDADAARLLIAAARHQLGLIDERYPARRFPDEHALLLKTSGKLQTIASEAENQAKFAAALALWRKDFANQTIAPLNAKQRQSLYDHKQLAKMLGSNEVRLTR